jgi:hypothetical protein
VLRALLVPVPVLTEPVFTEPLLPTSVLLVLALVPGELLSAGVVAPPFLTGGLDRGEDGELAAPCGDVLTAGLVV